TENVYTFSPDTSVILNSEFKDIDWNNLSTYDTIILFGLNSWILRSMPGLKIRDAKKKGARIVIIGQDDMLSVYKPDTFISLKNLKSKISNLKSELKSARSPIIIFNPGVNGEVLAILKENLKDIPMVPVYTKSNMRTLVKMGINFPTLNKRFKGVFVFGEDPVGLSNKPDKIEEFFKDVEFIAVCDLFQTKTAELADVVIPAASFAEINGTFLNMMGKSQNVKKAIEPLTGYTNIELLKILSKDIKKDKKSNISKNPTNHITLKIKSNADCFENRVRERLIKLGIVKEIN
ncbi:molybdopterin-dependent oxidoreductase, partial [candidate division WOR-3 bacterium]|nr:molybdopterin-dependent oxidoreductase [candidate division WOR-3 bacterium]